MGLLIKKRLPNVVVPATNIKKEIAPVSTVKKSMYDKYIKMGKGKPSKKEKESVEISKKVAVIKKEIVTKKESKGPNITNLWVTTLTNTAGKHITDKAIAFQMCQEADKAKLKHKIYSESDVTSCRNLYNKGKLSSQKGIVPKIQLVRYEVTTFKADK